MLNTTELVLTMPLGKVSSRFERRLHPTGWANNTSIGGSPVSLLHTLTWCLHTNPLSKVTRPVRQPAAVETGGQGNCPIEISPLGQKASNFRLIARGRLPPPTPAHLGVTGGQQASALVTTLCLKGSAIPSATHTIPQYYSFYERMDNPNYKKVFYTSVMNMWLFVSR